MSGSQLRFFASVTNGRKIGRKIATVNKNNSKAKELTQSDQSPLTIYPFSIDKLKKPQNKTNPTNKIEKNETNKTKKANVSASNIPENNAQNKKPAEVKKQPEQIVKQIRYLS